MKKIKKIKEMDVGEWKRSLKKSIQKAGEDNGC